MNQNNKVFLIIHIGYFFVCLRHLKVSLPSCLHIIIIDYNTHVSLVIFISLLLIERRCDTSNRVRQKSLITQGNNIYMKMGIQSVEQANIMTNNMQE